MFQLFQYLQQEQEVVILFKLFLVVQKAHQVQQLQTGNNAQLALNDVNQMVIKDQDAQKIDRLESRVQELLLQLKEVRETNTSLSGAVARQGDQLRTFESKLKEETERADIAEGECQNLYDNHVFQ